MLSASEWWRERRKQYNIGLIVAGVLAFASYAAVVHWRNLSGVARGIDVTLFTMLFQGVGYLIMMAVANILYFSGPRLELALNPDNVSRYRRITFGCGFWCSVFLPFTVPLLLFLTA
jgi:hypothetical protein